MSNEQGHTFSVPLDNASYLDVPPLAQFGSPATTESLDLHQKESDLRREEESVQTTLRELNRRFLATQAARKKAEAEELTRQRLEAEAKVELEASRTAAECELRRLEQQVAQREADQTAKLQAEKDDRERLWLETQWFLEEEKQIQAEIEKLQKAAAELTRRKTALANLKAEQARILEEEALRKQNEGHRIRLAELNHAIEAARLDLLGLGQQEADLAAQFEHLKKTGAEQRLRLEEAAKRLRTERENQIAEEMDALRRAAGEQRKQEAEAEALRTAEVTEQLRLAELARAEAHNKLEAAKELLQVQQDEIAQLDDQLALNQKELETSAAREVQLKSLLEELARRTEAQRQQIAEAEDARQRAEQTFKETTEAVRLVTEEANQRLAEATALRNQSQEESTAKTNELQQLRSEIEQLGAVVQSQNEEAVTLRAQLAAATSNRETLVAQLRELKAQCASVAVQIETAKQANLDAKSHHDQQLNQLASLEQQESVTASKRLKELEDLRKAVQEKAAQATKELEERRQALQNEAERTEQHEQMVQRDLESLRAKSEQDSLRRQQLAHELEQHLAQLELAAREQEEQLEQARTLRATREENLKQAAAAAAEEYEQEWTRLDAMASEHALLQSKRIAELKAKRASLEEEQRQTASVEQRIKSEIEAAQTATEEQRLRLAVLRKAQKDALEELERSRDEVDENVANERRQIKAARKHAEDEECRLDELQRMRAEIEASLANCLARRYEAANELESVRATLAAAEKENRDLESQVRARVAEQQKACAELVSVREQLEEESQQLERVRQRSLDELDLLKHKTEELARRHTVEQERRLAELEALRTNTEAQKNLLAQEEERRRNEIVDLEQTNPFEGSNPHQLRIEEERRRIKSLRKRNEDEERRLSELEKMRVELENELQSRVGEENAQRSSLEELFTADDEPEDQPESSDNAVLELDELDLQRTLAEFASTNFSQEVESDSSESVLDTVEFSIHEETPAKAVMPGEKAETPTLRLVETPQASSAINLEAPAQQNGLAPFEPNDGSLPAVLMRQLTSDDDSQRAAALADISRFGGDSAYHVITNSFDDPSTKVRNAAVRALYNLDSDCAQSFTRALREGSPKRRNRIGKAIAESGLAQDVLRDLVGESRERTYGAFSLLFLMVKAGEVSPLIHAIEEHQNLEVRLTAITLLVNSGHPEVSHLFRRLAVRGSLPPEVRSAAMEALHQLGSTN